MTSSDQRSMRCSDDDRERVAEQLRHAAGDGRLTLTELEDRLERVFEARTYGDLDPITRDLPDGAVSAHATPRAAPPVAGTVRLSAIFGQESRSGRWDVPPALEVVAVFGGCTLDLTHAVVRHRVVDIWAQLWFGNLTVVVPEGIDVRLMPGSSFLSGRSLRTTGRVTQGAPRVRIGGTAVCSKLTVRPSRMAQVMRSLFGR